MRTVIWFVCLSLAATEAFGQRARGLGPGRGGLGGGPVGPRAAAPPIPFVGPIPLVGPIPPLGMTRPDSRFPGRPGFGGFMGSYGYPLVLGDYAYPAAYEAAPEPVVIPPAPPIYVMRAPTPIPRSEIREYKSETQQQAAAEEPNFSIALTDGSVRSAVAVFVQGNMLAYVDPDDRQQRIPLDAVDRETTKRLNQALKLNLYLPPPSR